MFLNHRVDCLSALWWIRSTLHTGNIYIYTPYFILVYPDDTCTQIRTVCVTTRCNNKNAASLITLLVNNTLEFTWHSSDISAYCTRHLWDTAANGIQRLVRYRSRCSTVIAVCRFEKARTREGESQEIKSMAHLLGVDNGSPLLSGNDSNARIWKSNKYSGFYEKVASKHSCLESGVESATA